MDSAIEEHSPLMTTNSRNLENDSHKPRPTSGPSIKSTDAQALSPTTKMFLVGLCINIMTVLLLPSLTE